MATIRAYTTIEQSRKLAQILPIESADMYYREWKRDTKNIRIAYVGTADALDLPCWSLAALLDVLPRIADLKPVLDLEINYIQYPSDIDLSATADNPVDACYEMILTLNELNLL